jgi:hypothetical protein
MRVSIRLQTVVALLALMAGVSALQTGALMSPVYAESMSALSASQVVFLVQPSANTVNAGAFAKFDVSIVEGSTSHVFLVASGVPPDSVAIYTPSVGVANPDFDSTLTILTSPNTPAGSYVVTAVAIVNGEEFSGQVTLQVLTPATVTSSSNFTTNGSPASALSMVVSTDQSQYKPNSMVNILGTVSDGAGNAVADAVVSVQVDGPTGVELFYTNSVRTDSAGTFQAHTSLPTNPPTGTYTVFASATKPNYSSVATRATFVVGQSTSPSVIIKTVYAGDSAGNPASTFTVGQTIWVWVVIENVGSPFQGVVWIQVRDPNGVPVQIQMIHFARINSGETVKEPLEFTLAAHSTNGVYTVNALVSDKLISQGGTFLASSGTQFALVG